MTINTSQPEWSAGKYDLADNIFSLLLIYNLLLYVWAQIPELDFEIPPEAQRGSLSTVFTLHLTLYFV